jgi:transcriptional regulator with XRE-family HTH domain
MKLKDWLTDRGMARNEFARRIGVTAGYITQLCDDEAWPSKTVIREIQRETKDAVTANDFVTSRVA